MNINFVYPAHSLDIMTAYKNIIDTIVDPILRYLPEGRKVDEPSDGLNVGFFTEIDRIRGCTVFIPHGIADKNYRTAERVKRYDHIFVSGPAWRDLYIRQGLAPAERIHIGGYTKMDPMFDDPKRIGKKIKVLWAPTHGAFDNGRKPATSSYPDFEEYLGGIKGIKTALHPAVNYGNVPTTDLLMNAAIVIADHGSIVYEALALNKPVIIPDWIVKEGVMKNFHASFECLMFEQDICYHAHSFEHLLELIEVARAKGVDPKGRSFIDAIFPPELRGRSGEVTAKMLREIAAGGG